MSPARGYFDRAASAVTQLVIYNFFAFWIIDLCIGGDALNGKIVNGQYLFDQNGRYTAVSHALWVYSRVHTISVLVTVPALLVFAAARSYSKVRTSAA